MKKSTPGTFNVGNEDAYVVEKTPPGGDKVVDYVSTTRFLPLQSKTVSAVGESSIKLDTITRYEDYRETGGVTMAFRIVVATAVSGEFVTQIETVKFDTGIPDSAFKGPKR